MKKVCLGLILLSFFIPIIQGEYHLITEKKLGGDFVLKEKPDSLSQNWLNGSFQSMADAYFEENFGFRNIMVRVNNQIRWSLFKKIKKNTAIIGENDILYDVRYINTTLGKDFVGEEEISLKLRDLETATKLLRADGKNLLLVLAPNKARYYNQEVPKKYKKQGVSNYERVAEGLKSSVIDYLDFNKWFINKKGKANVELIPKYGIHWTGYSSSLVIDSIIDFCNKKYKYNLPTYTTDSITETTTPRSPDYDLGETLNLMFDISKETYLYPNRSLNKGEKKNTLVIADSFYNNLHYNGFSSDVINLKGFWYYNKRVIGKARSKTKEDFVKTIPDTDLIIIMLTEWNLYRMGFGIVDEINLYYNKKGLIEKKILDIKKNKKWFDSIKKQAIERDISVETMLVKAARFVLRDKEENKLEKEAGKTN